MNKKIFYLIPLVALLAGCSSEKHVKLDLNYITAQSAPVPAVDRNAQANLAEASTSVSGSLQQLAAIKTASHPDLRLPSRVNPGAVHMTQRTSINWTGPVEPLLTKVAKSAKYKFEVIGKKPVIPVIVAVNKRNKPLAVILQDITYQVVNKAQIKVYPKQNVIQLRYFEN